MRALLSSAIAIAILILGMVGMDFAWAQSAVARPSTTVEWASWIRAIWPILVVVVGAICTGVYLGLAVRFPSIAAFNSLKAEVASLKEHRAGDAARIERLEEIATEQPTRIDLQLDIANLSSKVAGISGSMDGLEDKVATLNSYLHTLIERGLAGR